MSFKLNIGDKTGSGFIQEFEKIPESTSRLDCSLNDLYKKSVDDLKAFSKTPRHVEHINLRHNIICAMGVEKLLTLFSSIPSTVESINISENGIDTLDEGRLFALKDPLRNIKTIYLSSSEISKISCSEAPEAKLRSIGNIFPNVKNVVFINNYGCESINDKNDHVLRRFQNTRKLFIKSEIPSLQEQTAYLVEKKHLPKKYLPEEMRDLCESLGADRYNLKKTD